jgi:arsenical pump membrane protein
LWGRAGKKLHSSVGRTHPRERRALETEILRRRRRFTLPIGPTILAFIGIIGLTASFLARSSNGRAAAGQDWPPFVLVSGLLLIGLLADEDRLFAAAGHWLARIAPGGIVLFCGAVLMIGSVTALLNLDTSVAFLTPVLVYAARSRGEGEAALLYGALLLSNAGSLWLPGSNLTNLIVFGHLHLTGGQFLAHIWPAALVSLVVTGAVLGCLEHRSIRVRVEDSTPGQRPVLGLGIVAVTSSAVLVVVLRNPAIPVAAIGVIGVAIRVMARRRRLVEVAQVLDLPVLVGLFGVAVALGTVGRAWSGPADLLSHLDNWGTAAFAAVSSVLVNNLPAASLLAARRPDHPFSMLVGLNLGPNLSVTGSLAWFLWLRAARSAGARPSLSRASRLGAFVVPLSIAAAIGTLAMLKLS